MNSIHVMKPSELLKAKYLKRTGTPKHYKYKYKQDKGKQEKDKYTITAKTPQDRAFEEKTVRNVYRELKSNPKFKGASIQKLTKEIVDNHVAGIFRKRISEILEDIVDKRPTVKLSVGKKLNE